MAIWEHLHILSGVSPQVAAGAVKPVLGLCILHQGVVTTEWALRLGHIFLNLQENKIPFLYMLNRNAPYDVGREMITRGALEQGVKYVFHLDTDNLIPANAIPLMMGWMEQFDKPVLSGLYWAKKPGPPMPAAWGKVGEKPEENRIEFMPIDIKPHLGTGAILQCDVVGCGCLLIKADVFKKLDKSNPNKQYFLWGLGRKDETTGKPLLQCSEDFAFCVRLVQELGIHPHVCVSITCDHIATTYRRGSDGEWELPMRV